MTTAYPGDIDSFTNPTASDTLNSITVPHATQHANANDAIEAIEEILGTNPEGNASTVGDRIGALETTVDTADTGLVDRVDALETGLGLDPFGGELALSINQVTAASADEVAAVDVDTESVVYFKFTVDGTEYAVPAYTITPAE